MCGRFVQVNFKPPGQPKIRNANIFDELPARYNMAPTQLAGVVLDDGGGLIADRLRWGLLPFWATEAKQAYSTINARIEGVATKPTYRVAFKRRRCLIPMRGYYEWTEIAPKVKQPWFISGAEETIWAAGLWEAPHKLLGDEAPATFTIITRDAFGRPADIHDRMPVLLPLEQASEWIGAAPDDAMAMLLAADPQLQVYKVGREVGNVKNEGPQLIEPVPS